MILRIVPIKTRGQPVPRKPKLEVLDDEMVQSLSTMTGAERLDRGAIEFCYSPSPIQPSRRS
jgi:hypothetical protein